MPSAAFLNLHKCIKTLIIPVTSASCERSFSAIKLSKTRLRHKTGDDRLSDLTVLFAHKNRLVDRAKLTETLAERLDRRLQFH
jgi:hAT family C-terminal dimerisation region